MKTGILIVAGVALATVGMALALQNSSGTASASSSTNSNVTKPKVTVAQSSKKLAPDFIAGGEWINSMLQRFVRSDRHDCPRQFASRKFLSIRCPCSVRIASG